MILSCNCAHKAQDALHGEGKRVMNPLKAAKGQEVAYRCTVCLKERTKKGK